MSDCNPNINRFFGALQTHIKPYNGSFVAVEGPNMTHKITSMPYLKFPYQQVLTGRVTLRAGQTNYLLNHLGLGDNATFLAITAQYDNSSKFEADNYVQYSYYSDKNRIYSFAQMLVLTGNSENRVEQLYIHNPNQNVPVVLEIMVAVIDDFYNFFEENSDSSSVSNSVTFENISNSDVDIWDNDDSMMIVKNSSGQAMLYLNLQDINALNRDGKILTIDEKSVGIILLIFVSEFEATQAKSKINQWINDYSNGVSSTPIDDYEPIITFSNSVVDDQVAAAYGSTLTSLDGDGSFVYNSSISLSDYNTEITKVNLKDLLISKVEDFESSIIVLNATNALLLKTEGNISVNNIVNPGEYYVFFDITDAIGNKVNSGINVKINIVG